MKVLAVLCVCRCSLLAALAQSPALTTVKDTVYKSDGTPASGTVVITWQAFVSADNRPVFGGTKTLPLTNGDLAVALVPNAGGTPSGTSYRVRYYQSGGLYFEETWVVPTSNPIASPNAPTVVPLGASGSTTYCYWVSATNVSGETLPSLNTCIANGNASLNGTNYNQISWGAVSNASGYKVYRTSNTSVPSGTGNYLVTTTASTSTSDQSNSLGSVTVPSANTTDPRTLSAVRVTAAPSPSVVLAPAQINGTSIVSNPTSTQTITAPNGNGIPLQISGRSNNNSNVFEIYNSQATPQLQSYFDSAGALVSSKVVARTLNAVRMVDQFSGADAGAKFNAACLDLPSTGGTIDGRGLQGVQTISTDIFASCSKPVQVLLGTGSYLFSALQTLPSGAEIIGSSGSGTELWWTGSSSGTMFQTATGATKTALKNLWLITDQGGTTTAVRIVDGHDVILENLVITGNTGTSGFQTAIRLTGNGSSTFSSGVYVHNVHLMNFTGAGISADHTTNLFLTDVSVNSAANNTTALGLLLDTGSDGIFVKSFNQSYGLNGLLVRHTNQGGSYGAAPAALFFDQALFDTITGGDAVLFDATLGSATVKATFTNAWVAAAGLNSAGAVVTPSANGLSIQGGRGIGFSGTIRLNANNGVYIGDPDAANVELYGPCMIYANNQNNNPDGHGIYVNAAATNLRIRGCRIGNVLDTGGNQKYGIKISTVASDQTILEGNDLNGNATGPFSSTAIGVVWLFGNFPDTVNNVVYGKMGIGAAPQEALDVRGHVKVGNGDYAVLALGDIGQPVGSSTSVAVWRADASGTASGAYLNLAGYSGTLLRGTSGTNGSPAAVQMSIENGFSDAQTGLKIGTGAEITRHLSATASLDYAAWAGNDCQDKTITVTGAADGDVTNQGIPSALASVAGVVWSSFVNSANTITIRGCKITAGASADPAAATVRADVWQH